MLYASGSLTYEVISNAIPRHHRVAEGNGSVSTRRGHAVLGQLLLFNFRLGKLSSSPPPPKLRVPSEKRNEKESFPRSEPDKLFMKDNKLRKRDPVLVPELFCHFLLSNTAEWKETAEGE